MPKRARGKIFRSDDPDLDDLIRMNEIAIILDNDVRDPKVAHSLREHGLDKAWQEDVAELIELTWSVFDRMTRRQKEERREATRP